MAQTKRIDLRGKVADVGALHFLRAEWQAENPRFVIIRHAINEKEQAYGLRLDLDKIAILDDVGDRDTAKAVRNRARDIWDLVASRTRVHA